MKIGTRRNRWPRGLLAAVAVLVILLAAGLVFLGGDGGARRSGELRALWSRLARRSSAAQSLPVLVIDMDFASYDRLVAVRERALRDGVYNPSEGDFCRASIRADGVVVPVVMRPLEGPAENLTGDGKWGFEVRTRQNQQLLGMQRLTLQDPADNNWLNQWAFVRALEREQVLAARYRFVRLVFNGDDRGIYALQEGFGSELAVAQGRQEGVIVRFDPDLLWRSIAHLGSLDAAYGDPVSSLSAADWRTFEVDAYRDADIARDPVLSAQREEALGKLRALQVGEVAAADVFDVAQYGRYLALVDLWGATEGTWLANLRYYHDPATGLLEPIGFNANALGSGARLPADATYGDPSVQSAYVREMVRVSEATYLDEVREALEPELLQLREALAGEAGNLELPWDALAARQEQMRRSLSPVQPVLAYLGPSDRSPDGIVQLYVGNVLNVPVELLGFDVHGVTVLPASREWLYNGSGVLPGGDAEHVVLRAFDPERTPAVGYVRFDIPLDEVHRRDSERDWLGPLDIQVITRIVGLSTTQMTLAQEGYAQVRVGGDE